MAEKKNDTQAKLKCHISYFLAKYLFLCGYKAYHFIDTPI